jgi:glutamate carboxypeptidase
MIYRQLLLTAVLCGLARLAVADSALSETEQRLVAAVDVHSDAALALLERVVNINSGTMNFAGVREVGKAFAAEFAARDLDTEWIDGTPFERAGHLVVRHPGPGPHVLMIGHLDTVFELDSPFQRYQRIDAGSARGPGTTDMKGGIVIMLQAITALRDADVFEPVNLSIVLTGDEEKVGRPIELARKPLTDLAAAADIVLGFEDADGDPKTAVVARRGSTSWELRITGRTAHSSQIFRDDIGSGAIYETARILDAFHDQLSGEQYLTFNPGLIVGGTTADFDREQARGSAFGKNNVIAEYALVSGDLRTISPEQLADARERMRTIVAQHRPHTSGEITFRDGYPPLAPTEGNRRLLNMFDQASRDLGFGPVTAVDPQNAGAADISFTAGLADMAIDGLGLMGDGGHTERETADLETLPMQAKRVAVLLHRLSSQ